MNPHQRKGSDPLKEPLSDSVFLEGAEGGPAGWDGGHGYSSIGTFPDWLV